MLQLSFLLCSGLWLSTFLPHFPNTSFALTYFSTAPHRVRYNWDSDSCQRSQHQQVSPLVSYYLPVVPSPNTWYPTSPLLLATAARCVISKLRHFSAGSPQYPAESGSFSYGPTVRLRLLPTSPRDDAVTFSYGAVTDSGRDLHPANSTPSRAYTKPLRGSREFGPSSARCCAAL